MTEYSADIHKLCFPFLLEEEVKTLFLHLVERTFTEKSEVLSPGTPAESCLFLTTGRIAVQQNTDFVGKVQVVGLLDPGAVFGEAGLLDGRNRQSTVIAIEKSTALELPRQDFRTIRQQSPDIAIKILEWLLAKTTLRLQKNSERLAKVL